MIDPNEFYDESLPPELLVQGTLEPEPEPEPAREDPDTEEVPVIPEPEPAPARSRRRRGVSAKPDLEPVS